MRWLGVAVACLIAISSCTPPTPTASPVAPASNPAAGAPASKPASSAPASNPVPTAAPSKPQDKPAAAIIDGIRLTVDGQSVDLPGAVVVNQERAATGGVISIGKNARPSALIGGNGVLLELQTANKDGFKDGFAVGDVGVATFTVWKGVEFSYTSMGATPNQPIKGLVFSQTSGKLAGAFEANLSGTLGKLIARVEFGVAMPK